MYPYYNNCCRRNSVMENMMLFNFNRCGYGCGFGPYYGGYGYPYGGYGYGYGYPYGY